MRFVLISTLCCRGLFDLVLQNQNKQNCKGQLKGRKASQGANEESKYIVHTVFVLISLVCLSNFLSVSFPLHPFYSFLFNFLG